MGRREEPDAEMLASVRAFVTKLFIDPVECDIWIEVDDGPPREITIHVEIGD